MAEGLLTRLGERLHFVKSAPKEKTLEEEVGGYAICALSNNRSFKELLEFLLMHAPLIAANKNVLGEIYRRGVFFGLEGYPTDKYAQALLVELDFRRNEGDLVYLAPELVCIVSNNVGNALMGKPLSLPVMPYVCSLRKEIQPLEKHF